MISIAKAHAYGNDFLFIPHAQAEGLDPAALARATCARHTGVGGDGLILYTVAPDGTARMTLYNTDGSPSELSGNGLRCLAALVLHQRLAAAMAARSTRCGLTPMRDGRRCAWSSHGSGRFTFRAAMGPPDQRAARKISTSPASDCGSRRWAWAIRSASRSSRRYPIRSAFHRSGPALATHPRFPAGTNVEFAVVEAPDRVRILIWERGVGPTLGLGHRRLCVGGRGHRRTVARRATSK